MGYQVILCGKAKQHKKIILKNHDLKTKTTELLHLLAEDPFMYPPAYEPLQGRLKGLFSRRLNIQHRIVYEVDKETRKVYVYSMLTHYGE